MLPFLKNKEEVPAAASEEVEDFGTIDAIAQDLLEGLEKKDKGLIKSALESFREHLKEDDKEQDQTLINKE